MKYYYDEKTDCYFKENRGFMYYVKSDGTHPTLCYGDLGKLKEITEQEYLLAWQNAMESAIYTDVKNDDGIIK